VQTPTDGSHQPQYRSLEEACRGIGRYLSPGQVVILESTVAPGTTLGVVRPLLVEASGLRAGLPEGFGLCFSYERVMVGRLVHNIRYYPRVVGGIDAASTSRAVELYRKVVRAAIHGTDIVTAEVAKTVENAYRDVQIAFANEVALICEGLGVDVYAVRQLVNGLPDDPTLPQANPVRHMHFPGAGVGGHCLPKDSWLLLHGYQESLKRRGFFPVGNVAGDLSGGEQLSASRPVSLLKAARYLNDWMPCHMVELLEAGLREAGRGLRGSRIGVLGYAFLEDSDDSRNTPTNRLLVELEKRGAESRVHDPYIRETETGQRIEEDLEKALEGCDGVVLMTRHSVYRSLTPARLEGLLRTRVVVDGRNTWDGQEFLAGGFIFKGVGKGNLAKSLSPTRRNYPPC